jgi:tetratricopeptide (TPR) repeat protein
MHSLLNQNHIQDELEEKFKEALILLKSCKTDAAEALYEEITSKMPQSDEILLRIFNIYYKRNEFDKAIKHLTGAIEINPDPSYYKTLGNTYYKDKNYEKAEEIYTEILKTDPDNTNILFRMGVACAFNLQYEDAKGYFNRVLTFEPDNEIIYHNLAIVHKELFEWEKAIECLVKSIELKPDYSESMFLLSEIFLQLGNFVDGWKLYEARFVASNGIDRARSSNPEWNGFSLNGKTIYIQREQGLGDCIMFARFIPILSEMGARVLFKPHAELAQLFKDSEIPAQIIGHSVPVDSLAFDTHLTLMSLARVLNINEHNIPYKDKYLKADPKKVKKFKEMYFNNDKFKIGIVWQCKNIYPADFFRSIPDISYLLPITKIPGVKVYSLQKGEAQEQLKGLPVEITDLGAAFKDFSDTAAAIENLDLVISVDTSVVHLSGALGKDTLVLIEHLADWKWLLDRDDSIWYEKVRLFRQDKNKNWEYAVNNAVKHITQTYKLNAE